MIYEEIQGYGVDDGIDFEVYGETIKEGAQRDVVGENKISAKC